jgi:hypothetical protein
MAFLKYFGQLPDMGLWTGLDGNDVEILGAVIVVLTPLAVLSGMPLAYKWDKTLGTIVNAGLAVYAVVVSIGLSLRMVGYALGVLTQLAG